VSNETVREPLGAVESAEGADMKIAIERDVDMMHGYRVTKKEIILRTSGNKKPEIRKKMDGSALRLNTT
jgi:hypothetical protein